MVKDHSDSEKENPLPPQRLLFPINSKGLFYMHHPTDRIAHTTVFVTPVAEHWLEREITQWVHPMKDRSDDPSHREGTLLPRSYISLPFPGVMSNMYFDRIQLHRFIDLLSQRSSQTKSVIKTGVPSRDDLSNLHAIPLI